MLHFYLVSFNFTYEVSHEGFREEETQFLFSRHIYFFCHFIHFAIFIGFGRAHCPLSGPFGSLQIPEMQTSIIALPFVAALVPASPCIAMPLHNIKSGLMKYTFSRLRRHNCISDWHGIVLNLNSWSVHGISPFMPDQPLSTISILFFRMYSLALHVPWCGRHRFTDQVALNITATARNCNKNHAHSSKIRHLVHWWTETQLSFLHSFFKC